VHVNAPEDDGPLWRVIADQLRDDIGNEVYAPGTSLPGETAMAERYQTSRPTVRRAIFELAAEGLISAAQGRGTFVRARPDRRPILTGGYEHSDLLDDGYDAAKAGWLREPHPDTARYHAEGHPHVTDTIITAATRDQAEALRIATGELILYRFQYWRHRQTQRVISITSISPAHLTGTQLGTRTHDTPPPDDREPDHQWDQDEPPEPEPFDEPDDAPGIELYELLSHNHGPVTFTTTISARMPRGNELNDLGTEPGIPLLTITRTMTDTHAHPLEATTIEAPADRTQALTTHPGTHTTGAILTL
jgi:DNA-binding GntR family transcriptional regulator